MGIRATICSILIVSCCVATSYASSYRAYFTAGDEIGPTLDSGYQTTLPIDIRAYTHWGPADLNPANAICVDPSAPAFADGCINGGFAQYAPSVMQNGREFEICQTSLPLGGDTGSCFTGGWSVAEMQFYVTFECDDGHDEIPVALNFEVEGNAGFYEFTDATHNPASTTVELHVDTGIGGGDLGPTARDGTWVPDGSVGTSDGSFAGSTGNTINGTFTGDTFMVPVGEPVLFTFRVEVQIRGNLLSFDPGLGILAARFSDGAEGGRGIRLPDDGAPVFDLPEGCRANAESICLYNNVLTDDNPCPVSGESQSWGTLKSQFH